MCITAIRCSTGLSAKGNICGYRIKSGLIMSASRVFVFLKWFCVSIGNISCKIIHIRNIVSVFRNFIDQFVDFFKSCLFLRRWFCPKRCCHNSLGCLLIYTDAIFLKLLHYNCSNICCRLCINTLAIVPCQSFLHLFHGNFLFFINKFTDRIQRICHVCNTKSLRAGKVINSASLLNGFTTFHAVIHHTGKEWKRTPLSMCHVNGIVCIYKQGNKIFHLFLICVIKLIKGLHLCDIACPDTDLDSFIHTIGENHLKRAAHIEECRIMPAVCLTGFLRFYASNDVIFPGICKRKSSVLQRRNDNLIIIISRKSDSCSCKLCSFDQEFMWRSVPYSYRKRRCRKMHMHGCLNTHKGKIVGHILTVFILAACDQVLEKAVACKTFC